MQTETAPTPVARPVRRGAGDPRVRARDLPRVRRGLPAALSGGRAAADGALGGALRGRLHRHQHPAAVGRRRHGDVRPDARRRGDRRGHRDDDAHARRLAGDRGDDPVAARHARAAGALAARDRRRHDEARVRHHRARRGHELAQPAHRGPPRRRPLPALRPEDLHLRRRGRATRCSSSPASAARTASSASRRSASSTSTRPGFTRDPIKLPYLGPDKQWTLFFDDVEVEPDRIVGGEEGGLPVTFDGLNPERVIAAAGANGLARRALEKACAYANERAVWSTPIGAHQAIAHPLARGKIELELARLMTQKAAALIDARAGALAGEASNMAKFAAAEAAVPLRRRRDPDPRRQRRRDRVRDLRPVVDGAAAAHRPGERADDPQPRGPARARAAEVLLRPAR